MFTGIVEEVGVVRFVGPGFLTVSAGEVVKGTVAGDSVAVNGVCLTATTVDAKSFSVSVMAETMRRTNLGMLVPGKKVNLERAVAAGGRFGGHFVQGHIDGTGRITSLGRDPDAVIMRVAAASGIMRYIVEKGFVAVDGVSLTVTDYDERAFAVSLVEFTRRHTTLDDAGIGDTVNIEVDIMAKYVEKFSTDRKSGISREFLGEHGFLSA